MKKEFIFRLVLAGLIVALVCQFGIRPMFRSDYYIQRSKSVNWAKGKIPAEKDQYDVIVVGEELEGIAAAVSAARLGARTLLVSQGGELAGGLLKSLQLDLEIQQGAKGVRLEQGMASELADRAGRYADLEKFKDAVNSMVAGEKKLEVVFGVLDLPVLDKDMITGVYVIEKGEKKLYAGKRVIDATEDGKLLELCGVPYYTGSGDLNFKHSFMPVRLNFEVEGIKPEKLRSYMNHYEEVLEAGLFKYKTVNVSTRIKDLRVIGEDDGRPVVQGVEVVNLDLLNEKAAAAAYEAAVNEAKKLTAYLSLQSDTLKAVKFYKAAERFSIREYRHFKGEYVLGVNDILENRDFNNKIAVASDPIDASKFAENGREYIMGKPVQYSIPMGCIVPVKVDNVLMVGGKISYSSLAATSAATTAVNVSVGEAAGTAAVYSIVAGMSPREVVNHKAAWNTGELTGLLKKQGAYLPDFSLANPNTENWCYPDVRKLNSLGLIAGGRDNNYKFALEAEQKDLATLLLNGVYRLSYDKYTLEFDAKLRPFFNKNALTKEKLGEILLRFHGSSGGEGGPYESAVAQGYINSVMQLRLKDKKALTLEDVYNLSVHNISLYTKKEIPD